MNTSRDIEKLFDQFGGNATDYQEIGRETEARTARTRWPLLATLLVIGYLGVLPCCFAQIRFLPTTHAGLLLALTVCVSATLGGSFAAQHSSRWRWLWPQRGPHRRLPILLRFAPGSPTRSCPGPKRVPASALCGSKSPSVSDTTRFTRMATGM